MGRFEKIKGKKYLGNFSAGTVLFCKQDGEFYASREEYKIATILTGNETANEYVAIGKSTKLNLKELQETINPIGRDFDLTRKIFEKSFEAEFEGKPCDISTLETFGGEYDDLNRFIGVSGNIQFIKALVVELQESYEDDGRVKGFTFKWIDETGKKSTFFIDMMMIVMHCIPTKKEYDEFVEKKKTDENAVFSTNCEMKSAICMGTSYMKPSQNNFPPQFQFRPGAICLMNEITDEDLTKFYA